MQAVTLTGFGSTDVLKLADVPRPQPHPHELLVKVQAAALNRADILQRKGHYPPPAGASDILGLEIAGDIVAMGKQVVGFNQGQRVCGLVAGGGYAEYCVLDSQLAMSIPEQWDYVTAAAMPEAFMTANETVFELGQLKTGESLLVHAGASGVGSTAIQMAKYRNAIVYFTAGSDEKIAKVLTLGADVGINYKTQNFAEEIKSLTRGAGVDVIEDFIGAKYFAANLSSLKPSGRLICVGLMGGREITLDLAYLLQRRIQIKGFNLRSQPIENKRLIMQRFLARWQKLLLEGAIKPIIDSVFPLAEVVKAHERMEANLNFGKIILLVDRD